MKKMVFRRVIAAIVLITLLPFESFTGCFPIKVQAAETRESFEETVSGGNILPSEETVSGGDNLPPEKMVSGGDNLPPEETLSGGDNLPLEETVSGGDSLSTSETVPDNSGFTLEEDTIISGNYYLTEGTLDLNGHALTIQGNLIQEGGVVFVNGGNLIIDGDYRMQYRSEEEGTYIEGRDGGLLQMINAEDYVLVKGSYVSNSFAYTSGALTEGTLEVKKDIIINNIYRPCGFMATGNHTLLLSGEEIQRISIGVANPNASIYRVANLEITNESEAGVEFEQAVWVNGEVNDHGNVVKGAVSMVYSTTFAENSFGGSIFIEQGVTIQEELNIKGDLILSSSMNVYGNVHVGGNCIQNEYGCIRMNKSTLEIEGNYIVKDTKGNAIYMQHVEDYIHVHGDVLYNSEYCYLTAGTFEIEGNLTSERGIQTFKVYRFLFSGDKRQEISISSDEYFGTIEIQNYSEEGVYFATSFEIWELIRNGCRVEYGDMPGEYGWTLSEDTVYEGDLLLIDDTLDLNGHTLTITGDFIQASGMVNVNGGRLIIEGDYRMQTRRINGDSYIYGNSNGILQMISSDDYVLVKGSFLSDFTAERSADRTEYLTDGILEIKKDVVTNREDTYNYSYTNSLRATGNHTLLLSGEGIQHINMECGSNSYYFTTCLANLEITNQSEEGVVFEQMVVVNGEINDHGNHVAGAVGIQEGTSFANNSFSGDVEIKGYLTLSEDFNFGGDLIVSEAITIVGNISVAGNCIQNSAIRMENGRLEVEGNYTVSRSTLEMTHEADYLYVHGDVEYNPYSAASLKAGTFEVGGNFTSTQGLLASGSHRFLFSGEKRQEISVAKNETFAVVEIQNYSTEGVYSTIVFNKQELIRNGCRLTYGEVDGEYGWTLTEDLVYEGDLNLLDEVMDLNGHTLTVTGDLNQWAGSLNINGGQLVVNGDYNMRRKTAGGYEDSTAKLVMQKENDRVTVEGNFVITTTTSMEGNITAGVLELRGNFFQYGENPFKAGENSTIIFSGKNDQVWRHDAVPVVGNIINQNGWQLLILSDVTVMGTVTDETANVTGTGALRIRNLEQLANGTYSGAVCLTDLDRLDQDLKVGSLTIADSGCLYGTDATLEAETIRLDGTLDVGNSHIRCNGNFVVNTTGRLYMQEPRGRLWVNGEFQFASKYNHSGYLTDGKLEILGRFIQRDAVNFVATKNHVTVFSGASISFQYAAGTTRFNKLVLVKNEREYYFSHAPETIANQVIFQVLGETPPEPIRFLQVTDTTITTATLSYEAVAGVAEISYYQIYRNGVRVGTTRETTYTDTGLLPSMEYTYKVYPVDTYQLSAQTSPEVSATTQADLEPPTVPEGLFVMGRTGSCVTLNWSPATDNANVVYYSVYRDGELVATQLEETAYKDNGLERNTVYTYDIVAYDTSGNVSAKSSAVEAVVAMPEITEISPVDYSTIGGKKCTILVKFRNVGNSTGNRVKIEYLTQEDKWELLTPDLLQQQRWDNETLYVSYLWDLSEWSKDITLRYTLYDADENTDIVEALYHIDKELPKLPEHFNAISDNGTVKLFWDASKSADCTYYKLYRKEAGEEEYTLLLKVNDHYFSTYTDCQVEEGKSYSYALVAGDTFSNESAFSEPVTVEVGKDLMAPEIESMTPKAGRVRGEVEICVTASDNKALRAVRLEYRGESEEEWKELKEITVMNSQVRYLWDTTVLTDGVYVMRAIVTDTAGNENVTEFTRRYEVDNTGIAKIELAEHSVTATAVQLQWEDVTEDDFAYFQVEQLVGGDFCYLAAVSNRLGYEISGLTPNTAYTYRVVGYDTLGNRGIPSDSVTVTTVADTTAPTIEAVYPVASCYNNQLALSVRARDNYAVEKALFRYSTDGVNYETIAEVKAGTPTNNCILSRDFDISGFPEGKIYIKFEVYDTTGHKNALLENGEDIIVEYEIDHTAPMQVEGLRAVGTGGYVELNWDLSTQQDVKAYKVYRADAGEGIFTVVQANCATKGFYDISVEAGRTYLYKVSAVDIAGNEGECSEECVVTVKEDKEIPVITGMTPTDKTVIGTNATISVVAVDNAKLASITLEYAVAGSDDWTMIKQVNVSDRSSMVSATWETGGLLEGTYLIRATAADEAGNISETYQMSVVLDHTAPAVPEFTAGTGHFEVLLNISTLREEDFSHYAIYRKEVGEKEYQFLRNIAESTYADTDVKPGIVYRYQIAACDKYGNVSWSLEQDAYADDVDVMAPTAVLPENLVGLVGMELAFDGMGSTDNVRITSYKWNMGNGDKENGSQPVYTYNKAGTYLVSLEVSDAAGNQATAYSTVRIYDRDGRGTSIVKVVDEYGSVIPYAYVYVQTDNGETMSLKADGKGEVTIAAQAGAHKVAAYATNYLPNDREILISEYETKTYQLTLTKEELIVGNLSVHRMTMEEMVEAGIDFSSPENYNRFAFNLTLTFAQCPIPVNITYINRNKEWEKVNYVGTGVDVKQEIYIKQIETGGGAGGSSSKEPEAEGEGVPIFAYVTTSQSVSWLKEMYGVELGILNAADSQYVIENSSATLNLPKGVSLATTEMGQSLTQSMGDIRGQERKVASWVVRGDESGSYHLSASFEGTLMPFDTKVSAFFETDASFEVVTGEGMHIYIMPEENAYDGKDYYIQFKIVNQSERTIYNFMTTIGPYQEAQKEYIVTNLDTGKTETKKQDAIMVSDPSQVSQSVVIRDGQRLVFPSMKPGDAYYGTYKTEFEGIEEDKEEEDKEDEEDVYYRLVSSLVEVTAGENLGVQVHVIPIAGHITKELYKTVEVPSYYGDPIDLTSGFFTDELTAFSLAGASLLNLDMHYASGLTETAGELGYGWYHDYEMRIEQYNGIIYFYSTPFSAVSFIHKNALEGAIYGAVSGMQTMLAQGEEYSYGEYRCLSSAMSDCRLVRNTDGTYSMTFGNGTQYVFDRNGSLTHLKDGEGRSISLIQEGSRTVVREDISGKQMYLNKDVAGRIISVTDDFGRQTSFTYNENNCMSAITNPVGDTMTYTYDAKNRIVSEANAQGTFVANEYDENGRVLRQTDALGYVTTLSYENNGDGMIVHITDPNGAGKQAVINRNGRITEVTNENGGTTSYTYDSKGNVICEKDSYGNCILKEYDNQGNLISITDTGNLTTRFTYDANRNMTTMENAGGQTAGYTYNEKNQMLSSTDYAGTTTTGTYNEAGQPLTRTVEGKGTIRYTYENGMQTSVTDFLGNTTHAYYDGAGNLMKTVDALGNATTYTVDKAGRTRSVTDALGNTTYYTYDGNGNLTLETDALGNKTSYTYDRAGRQTKVTYADGTFMEYTYDAMGHTTQVQFADGTKNTYGYDTSGNLTKETLADGTVFTYTYDLLNRRTTETDKDGNRVTYEYYPNGNPYRITYPDGTYELYTYNEKWKVATFRDKTGHTTSYEYDAMSNVTMVRDALGNAHYYEYDAWGRLAAETDPNGNTTRYAYDANDNCISKTDAMGVTVYMEYDALNRMTRVYFQDKTGEEYSVSYAYDALGRVESVTDELGNTTHMTYDKQGNLFSTTDANGVTISVSTYDAMGRVTKVTDALGLTTTYSYDTMGNLLQAVEQLNGQAARTTTYEYDTLGRVIQVTDPLAGVTGACYDERGNLSSLTDANGGTTRYSYDSMGRMIEKLSPMGSRNRYRYNARGLLEETENARGQKTAYTYDAIGRVTSMTDELGRVDYTYDRNGNVLTVTDSQGTIQRDYDALNRVTRYTDCRGNTVTYAYDEIGNLISLTYPGGEIVRYTYYKNGLLHTVTDENGRVTTYEYDKNGNLTHTIRPNGTEEICTYNAAGMLSEQTDVKGEEVLTRYTYTYDGYGNLTATTGMDTEEGIQNLTGATMTYDADNRLRTYNGQDIQYDADGNMTYGPVNGVMSTLTYDCRNRLVQAGGITYTYDAENNRIQAETDTYVETYVTDTVSSSLSRVLTMTVYEKSDMGLTDSGITTTYLYGQGLICERLEGLYLYHHYNNLGSTMKLSDAEGAIIASYTYGVYGELLSGNPSFTHYLYNGRCGVSTDANGLYYMRQRYYNPEIKRFVNQDILTGSLTNSQSLNRYSYVQGNPISYTDPFGLSPLNGLFSGTNLVHAILGLASCIPGWVGAIASAVDAAVYLFVDKDFGMAALCALNVVAFGFGRAASALARAGTMTNTAKVLQTTCSMISHGASFAVNGAVAYSAGKDIVTRYLIDKQPLDMNFVGDCAAVAMGVAGCTISGVSIGNDIKQMGSMLGSANYMNAMKEEVHGLAQGIKERFTPLDNRGCVDFGTFTGRGNRRTPVDIYSFGNTVEPRGARPKQDFGLDSLDDIISPQRIPFPNGASNVTDISNAPLSGHYYTLPQGTELPRGLDIIADGRDVFYNSPHGSGHYTIFPTKEMTVTEFNDLYKSLPWIYGGKK